MSAVMSSGHHPPVSGRVDAEGRLISADPRLLALHIQSGGEIDGTLIIPSLAAVVRLAQNLGIAVSRNVIAADGANDLDLIVRAVPDGRDVVLDVDGWVEQKAAAARFGTSRPQNTPQLIWHTDETLAITSVSDAAIEARFRGQKLGAMFSFLVDDEGAMPIIDGLAQRVRFAGQRATLREGDEAVYELDALPVFDRPNTFTGWRGRATLANANANANAHAATLVSAPEIESSRDSHRYGQQITLALRSPLERIVTQADGISGATDGPVGSAYRDYANDIAAAGRHLLGLVNDLTETDAIEASDFRIEPDDVDLADVARRAASLLGIRAASRNVRIEALGADEHLLARGDFRRILQILVNLIGNAVRYSPPGSVVWVRMEHEGDLAALIVADQGKGIAADAHERIFEKFARVDPNEPGGTGLGLYISRKLARAMAGDITVDSAPGQGARFVLTLPMHAPTSSG